MTTVRTRHRLAAAAMAVAWAAFAGRALAAVEARPSLSQPAVSPDGAEVAFVHGGNLWTVPAAGGDAHLLLAGAGDVLRPLYSPDGRQIAFTSVRTGNGDLYVFTIDTGALRRVTFDDASERLDAWSPDGRYLYYTTGSHDVGGCSDCYRVEATGGTPMPVVAERYRSEFAAAPHKDGTTVAFCADGMSYSQWWRHGHSHLDESELWLATGDADHRAYRRLSDYGAKNLWPSWGADGRTLYYFSDRDGAENLWSVGAIPPTSNHGQPATRPAVQEPRAVTHFRDGRVLWPATSANGRTIVFERDFGLWKVDLTTGAVGPIAVRLRGAVAGPTGERRTDHSASEVAVSHDGRKMAVVIRGQVYACAAGGGTTENGSLYRVTRTDAVEGRVAWANDDRRIVYTSTRDGPRHLYLYDFGSRTETRLTDTPANDGLPSFAPDDAAIAFARDGRELRVLTVGRRSGKVTGERVLARGLTFERPPFDGGTPYVWAPRNGDWIACVSAGPKGFRNLYLVPTAGDGGGVPKQVSFLANAESNTVAWSAAGSLFFASGQRTEDFQLARVDLAPRTPTFRQDQFSDLFRDRTTRTPPGNPNRTQPPRGDEPTRPAPAPTTTDGPTDDGPAGEQPIDPPDVHPTPVHRPSTPQQPDRTTPTQAPQPATKPGLPPVLQVPATTRAAPVPATRPVVRPPTVTRRPPPPPGQTDVDFDDIDQRLSLLPVGMDVNDVTVSPDGQLLAFVGVAGNVPELFLMPLDANGEAGRPRILTVTTGGKSQLQFAPDPSGGGLRLYYLEDRQVHSVPANPNAVNAVTDSPVAADVDVDFDRDKVAVFEQAWRYLNENFHDPDFHGVNWPAARAHYAPLVAGARTPAELRRAMSLMIGELNSSHMGVSGPPEGPGASVGKLGVTFDPAEYARSGRLKVASILPFGPAALVKLDVGQFIVAVDGTSAERPNDLDELLDHKVDKEVTLTVAGDPADAKDRREVKILACGGGTERTLGYRAWVQANRAYVAKASGGRLGYVHLADMTEQEMARLSTDLDARNESHDGVVVDVRNNNGGFVNGFAIDVFARQNYLTLKPRGFPKVPGRVALGQRYVGLPTVLVTNRHTLSDGEDFAEGYQALGLGPTVGEPTAGWIIFTSGVTLLDGTSLRLPVDSVYDRHGEPMEMHPRPVDDLVIRPEGEATAGRDSQLDAAVRAMLDQLGAKRQ